MLMFMVLAASLSIILIIINSIIAMKITLAREKISPFECGFDPKSTSRSPFSLRFYLISLIFLIFDVEITLILPIPMIYNFMPMGYLLSLTIFFIGILLVGLFHEWNQGALEWDI